MENDSADHLLVDALTQSSPGTYALARITSSTNLTSPYRELPKGKTLLATVEKGAPFVVLK